MQESSSLRLRTAVLFLMCAAIVACSKKFEPLPKFQGDSEFVLVHTEHNLGNIEPCSCNNRTTGGFPRRQTALNDLRSKHPNLLTLDGGNSLFSEDRKNTDPMFFAQAKLKAVAVAEAFVKTKLDAMVFGEMDLFAGGDFFLDVVKQTGLPIVAANVFDRESGKPYFEQYKIFDCDGLKVAVIGLIATELHPTVSEPNEEGSMMVNVNQKVTIILEDRFERRNIKIEDPVKTAQDLMPEILSKAHVVIALTHLPPTTAQNLPSQVPGISFVVGRHVPTTRSTFVVDPTTQTMMLAAPMNGLTLGVGRFTVRGGSLQFEDYSGVESADLMIATIQAMLDDLKARYNTTDPESLAMIDDAAARKAFNQHRNLAYYTNIRDSANPTAKSNFKHYGIRLDGKEHGDDPEMIEHIRAYRAKLPTLYDPANTARAKMIEHADGMPQIVGAPVCASCHRPQTEFWRNTKHGQAWQTMVDYKVDYDLECILCHTVGFMMPGGFDRPDRVAGFQDVQCENCHGPGSAHLDNPLASNSLITEPSQMACERCHNKEHSPAFKKITYVPRASCPPIDPWEPLMRGAYGRIRTDLEEKLEAKGDSAAPFTYTGLVDILLRLEKYDDAIRIAERGMKAHDRISKSMTLAIARALDGLGQTQAALDRLTAVYETFQNDDKYIALLIRLLVHGRDPAARNLVQARVVNDYALTAFEKESGVFRLFRAEIEHASGNPSKAIELLEGLVKNSGTKSTELSRILARWHAEIDTQVENALPPPMRIPPQPK